MPAARQIIGRDGPMLGAWRLFAGLVGGHALASGMVAAMGSMLPLVGMPRGEAVSLAILLALIAYAPTCLAMLASGRPWRDGLALFATAGALIALASMF
jgi:hypothetical protein